MQRETAEWLRRRVANVVPTTRRPGARATPGFIRPSSIGLFWKSVCLSTHRTDQWSAPHSCRLPSLPNSHGSEVGYFGARRDLSPLAGMKLSKLDVSATNVADLTPLTGMPITHLTLGSAPVSRIEALRGMPLQTLSLGSTVVDCSPLKGAPIENLFISGAKISDVSFAKGMPLHTLHLTNSSVSNIEGLRGLPLETLILLNSPVSDLSPLQDAPLKTLDLRGCKKLTDYTPVLTLPRLERLHCDAWKAKQKQSHASACHDA